jgi:hypothetical protein
MCLSKSCAPSACAGTTTLARPSLLGPLLWMMAISIKRSKESRGQSGDRSAMSYGRKSMDLFLLDTFSYSSTATLEM